MTKFSHFPLKKLSLFRSFQSFGRTSSLVLGSLVVLVASGCEPSRDQKKPVQATVVVRLVHDPEVRALLSSVKEKFYIENGKLSDGTPLALELIPELNVPAARRLASGELKAEAWITPLSSLAEYTNERVQPLGAKQINCRPLFRTPMVITAPANLAGQLHATDGHVAWSAIIEQLNSGNGAFGGSGAPVAYSHGFPESSASGPMGLTFLMRLASGARASSESSESGNGDMASPASLSINKELSEDAITRLIRWERLVSHYSMSESYLMERAARSTLKRLYLSLASEQQLKLFQRSQREDAPKLVGLFPEEGTIWNTYQLCLSDAPWVTAAHRSITDSLVAFFGTPEGGSLPESFGFRPIRSVADSKDPVPGNLQELSGKQLGQLLERWPGEIEKPGALMVVLDASGSMEGESLRAAKESLRNLLPRLSSRDRIGLVTFASEAKDRMPIGTSLEDILKVLETTRAIGGSAAYDAMKTGIDELASPSLNGHRRTLLMITDGEGANSELSLQGIQDFLSDRLARYDVNILIVGLKREGANFSDFERLARGVNGYFRAANPSELVNVIQDAMRNV